MRDSYKRRVQRGIKLLNINVPNWLDRIDLSEFDMRIGCKCILGQLFRSSKEDYLAYCKAVSALNMDNNIDEQAKYGFELSEHFFKAIMETDKRDMEDHSRRLHNAWVEAITNLKAKKVLEIN